MIGKVDETTGQQIVAFVDPEGETRRPTTPPRCCGSTSPCKIGKLARPTTIIFTPDLPKTCSGKIMRRLLKDVAEERELGDVTTLADPAIVEEIRQGRPPPGGVSGPGSGPWVGRPARPTCEPLTQAPEGARGPPGAAGWAGDEGTCNLGNPGV